MLNQVSRNEVVFTACLCTVPWRRMGEWRCNSLHS